MPHGGFNALPIIADAVTVEGNRATVTRGSTSSSPFRLLEVAGSRPLILRNVVLSSGENDHVEGDSSLHTLQFVVRERADMCTRRGFRHTISREDDNG